MKHPKPQAPSGGFWKELRAAARPIAAYWILLVVLFGAFSVAALLSDPSMGASLAVLLLGGTTAAAVATGQALALLRVRDWLLYVFALVWWTAGFLLSAALGMASGPVGGLVAVVVFLFPLFLTGGLWSLRTGRALFAAWVPLMYASGAAILIAEARGKVATWMAGQKYAIWDVSTFGVLVVGIVLLLAFLLAREGHRLHLWRHGPRSVLAGSTLEQGAARPRLTLLGWLLLCGLAFGVAVGAAVLAPYLWRTAPAEEGTASDQPQEGDQGEPQQARPEEGDEPTEAGEGGRRERRKRGPGEDSDLVEVREDLRPDEQGGGGVVIDPLLLLFLALAGLVLGGPPARRLWIVDRLRSPPPGASATARIEGWWRLIEIALTDAGLELRPGEPPGGLLARASPVLRAAHPLDVTGLEEAAAIRDRVAYGLGVAPSDLRRMEEVAVPAFDTLWDRLGDGAQVRALYRIALSEAGDATLE